jgi:hypothetical protein
VDIPATGMTLPDGTEVVTKFPIELNSQWQRWLGIQASQVSSANLVLARRAADGFPSGSLPISDGTSWDLAKRIENVFSMLRLLGTIEYESAFLIMGYVQSGQAVCQHFSKFGRYEITRGCLPWLIREDHLATATSLAQSESLACLAYAKIFADNALQQHFQTDAALDQLWRRPEDEVRVVVGCVCDITKLKLVKNYDSWGRAVFSEWPTGWREGLERKNEGHAGDTFHSMGSTA